MAEEVVRHLHRDRRNHHWTDVGACGMKGSAPRGMVRMLAALLLLALLSATGAEDVCRFPVRWHGSWFQSGFRQPITIEGNRLSTKGHCLMAEGDKFVVVDEKGCYRCVVIHEKHVNVLQYKETFCHSRDNLSSLCSLITGDALLFSMFRMDALPIVCPFEGPFTFTYNRGHGDCRSPVSSIDSCTEESRLLLSYQACPDVYGTESTVEELECLAKWKEGSSRYLVGKIHHNHATSNEDRYRCFVYEKVSLSNEASKVQQVEYGTVLGDDEEDGVDYRVAQSGDATCNGLSSPMEGSRTMNLKRASTPDKCVFPMWLTASTHWHTLNYTRSYSFHLQNTTLRIANTSAMKRPLQKQHELKGIQPLGLTTWDDSHSEMRVVCTEIKQGGPDVAYIITHFTKGCQSGFVCMVFYRRDGHVIEVQTGNPVRRAEDACQPSHFNKSALPFVTLVTSSPEPRQCPHMGKFSVTGVTRDDHHLFRSPRSGPRRRRSSRDVLDPPGGHPCSEDNTFTTLVVGCSSLMDTMEFRSDCTATDVVSAYSCHGRWEDNGTHYLITTPLSRSSHGARRFCFMYREVEGVVHFSSSSDSCQRNISPGVGGALAFNVTSSGQCIEANPSPRLRPSSALVSALLLVVVLRLCPTPAVDATTHR